MGVVVISNPGGGAAVRIGNEEPLVLFCGPCVIENRDSTLYHAEKVRALCDRASLKVVFKSSYDKANRTSATSFRGVGITEGLEILSEVRRELGLPVVTDVHSPEDVKLAGEVVDVIQIPAFLCRQTDLLLAAGRTGKPVLVKKGQFVAPADMQYVVDKIRSTGNQGAMVCDRGTCFGYRDLVIDFRSIPLMLGTGAPVVMDITHGVQSMGGGGGVSGGDRRYVPMLARAAVAAGADGIFLEVHENPAASPSDSNTILGLSDFDPLVTELSELDVWRKGRKVWLASS